jgi:hypothetical protein
MGQGAEHGPASRLGARAMIMTAIIVYVVFILLCALTDGGNHKP